MKEQFSITTSSPFDDQHERWLSTLKERFEIENEKTMIEERVNKLIETYNHKIDVCKKKKESYKASYKYCLSVDANNTNVFVEGYARCITCCDHEIATYKLFIELLEYVKVGERK